MHADQPLPINNNSSDSELTCDEENCWCDEGSNSPAVLLEDGPGEKHHGKGDSTGGRGEVTHEG